MSYKFLFLLVLSSITFGHLGLSQCETLTEPTPCTNELKGPVKSVLGISYSAEMTESGMIKKEKARHYSWELDSKKEYDSHGNLLREIYLDESLKPIRSDIFTYKNDQLIQSKSKYISLVYKLNNNKRIESARKENSRPPIITSGLEKPLDTPEVTILKHQYNDQGNLMQIKEVSESGDVKSTQNFRYDSSGKIIYKDDVTDGYTTWYDYHYDSTMIKEIRWSDSDEGLLEKTIFGYDQNSNVILELWELYIDGEMDGYVKTTFEGELPIEIVEVESNGDLVESETNAYVFDQFGNWIIKRINLNDEKFFIIERQIEYY